MRKLFFISALLLAQPVWADIESDDVVHAAAHIGISYTITHVGTVACQKLTDTKDWRCTSAGALTALAAGVAKEAMDASDGLDKKNAARSMTQNVLGIGAAVLVIHVGF